MLACAAQALPTHCAIVHQPSCRGLPENARLGGKDNLDVKVDSQLVGMCTIFCLFLFRIVVTRFVPTTRVVLYSSDVIVRTSKWPSVAGSQADPRRRNRLHSLVCYE